MIVLGNAGYLWLSFRIVWGFERSFIFIYCLRIPPGRRQVVGGLDWLDWPVLVVSISFPSVSMAGMRCSAPQVLSGAIDMTACEGC